MAYPLLGNNNQLLTNLGTGASIFQTPKTLQAGAQAAQVPAADPFAADRAQIKSLQDMLASNAAEIKRMQLAQPKIYNDDIAGASAKARAAASQAVNPYYTQQLNKLLEDQRIKQERAQQDAATGSKQIDQALSDALGASQTSRTRTGEDAATKLADINNSSDYYQQTEGNMFDKAREALLTDRAIRGLTTGGLGGATDSESIANRNAESAQQTRSFNVQKEAVNTLKTRTFEDLATSDTQNTRNAGQKKDLIKIDLDRALQDVSRETESGKSKNEYERLNALANEESKQYQLGVNQFIQALASKGARAQDIQATRAIYG